MILPWSYIHMLYLKREYMHVSGHESLQNYRDKHKFLHYFLLFAVIYVPLSALSYFYLADTFIQKDIQGILWGFVFFGNWIQDLGISSAMLCQKQFSIFIKLKATTAIFTVHSTRTGMHLFFPLLSSQKGHKEHRFVSLQVNKYCFSSLYQMVFSLDLKMESEKWLFVCLRCSLIILFVLVICLPGFVITKQ